MSLYLIDRRSIRLIGPTPEAGEIPAQTLGVQFDGEIGRVT